MRKRAPRERSNLTLQAQRSSPLREVKLYAKVVGCKRDHDGNPVVDPSIDEPVYNVEYPDGSLSTEGYNALISALNLQLDEFGDEYYTF